MTLRFVSGAPDLSFPADATSATDAVAVYESVELLLAGMTRGEVQVHAASVCVPTSQHHAVSALLLQAGVHVLVEKPITSTLEQADDLIHLAREHECVLMVGHLERFNPAVQALAPLLREPMFFEAHRLSVFSPRSLDTDVVLDLMIHDLDIVLQLTQSPVTQVHAVGLPILSSKTDIANVRVEFGSGCVANFTASRVSTERVRKLRFFQPHQYLSVDYARQDLLVIEVKPPASNAQIHSSTGTNLRAFAGQASPASLDSAETASGMAGLGMRKPGIVPGEPLRLEIESFLQSVETGGEPAVSGEQARAALALALQIQQAILRHAEHAGLRAFQPNLKS